MKIAEEIWKKEQTSNSRAKSARLGNWETKNTQICIVSWRQRRADKDESEFKSGKKDVMI